MDEPAVALPAARGSDSRRWAALGLVVGPVAFVSAWAVGGLLRDGYSPVHDAISRLAAVDTSGRWLMTGGFVVYGAAVLVGAGAMRGTVLAPAAPAVVVNALATFGVAALPLDVSDTVDLAHGVAATVGYVSLAAAPALSVGPLRRAGHRRAAIASTVAAAAIAGCLALTVVADAKGLAQRTGLGIGDAWLVAAGLALVTDRLRPVTSR